MNIVERLISQLAPSLCMSCRKPGQLVCSVCSDIYFKPASKPPLPKYVDQLFVVTDYTGLAKKLISATKFERAKTGAELIGHLLHQNMPELDPCTIVCPIPTSNSRARLRGYDQAVVIAKTLAKSRQLRYQCLITRLKSTRQVGSGRQKRRTQLAGAFHISSSLKKDITKILLVDDVLTTGATVEAAAATIKKHQALRSVYLTAATFAYKP